MTDREKVIEALLCKAYDDDLPCSVCAYYRPDEKPVAKCDYSGLMDDAIALLKEQEAVEPTWRQGKAYCGSCGKRIPLKIGARFCHKCGRSVKWSAID